MILNTKDNWNGADYANSSNWQKSQFEKFFDYSALNGCESILNVGCGDGKLTACLAEKIPQANIIGINISSSMHQMANETFPSENNPNLSFFEGDARTFSFSQNFDYIVSNYALHWVKGKPSLLKMFIII